MKNFKWLGLAALVLSCAVQAASFDCAKAQTRVEKMICADAELSKLDEEMAQIYAAALQDKSRADAIRQAQRQWVRGRNQCADAICVRQSYQAQLQALSTGSVAAKQVADKSVKPQDGTEAAKAARIQALLGQHAYKLTHTQDQSFCNNLFKALQTNSTEISYVEPILRTDDPEHPGLAKYEACYRDERPRGESSFVLCAVGTRRFRLYRLDMDGNPKNGREEYLYGQEPDCNQNSPAAQYAQVNLRTCQHQQANPVAPESPLNFTKSSYGERSTNALVSFRNEYLVVDFRDFEEAGISMTAWIYDKQRRWFKSPFQCAWHSVK